MSVIILFLYKFSAHNPAKEWIDFEVLRNKTEKFELDIYWGIKDSHFYKIVAASV